MRLFLRNVIARLTERWRQLTQEDDPGQSAAVKALIRRDLLRDLNRRKR